MRFLALAPYFLLLFASKIATAQGMDSIPVTVDSSLRIVNLNPYITLHVDSSLNYKLEINRQPGKYFWYLRNSPLGLRINKDNGSLSFKADKSFFLSGKKM